MDQTPQLPSDDQLQFEGVRALNRAPGRVTDLRFISLVRREPTDYVDISRTTYEGQSVDEIFDRAKAGWHN